MAERFTDQVAIVTGAGRGIGQAVAEGFGAEGARVALLARTTSELEETATRIGKQNALIVRCDVSSEDEVRAAFRSVRELWGWPHHLVNNAGTVGPSVLTEMTASAWDRVHAVNLRGPFLCAREFLRGRPPERGGSIVNVTSISGAPGSQKFPGFGAYAASKAGLHALTEVLAVEAAPLNVRVNAVSPGSTDTRMLREVAPGLKAGLQPQDVARVILFACSEESRAMRGRSFDAWG
jgi:NAD(P)-dependent dehydrogenase (short-subunit alcohol dehydrogenase family)